MSGQSRNNFYSRASTHPVRAWHWMLTCNRRRRRSDWTRQITAACDPPQRRRRRQTDRQGLTDMTSHVLATTNVPSSQNVTAHGLCKQAWMCHELMAHQKERWLLGWAVRLRGQIQRRPPRCRRANGEENRNGAAGERPVRQRRHRPGRGGSQPRSKSSSRAKACGLVPFLNSLPSPPPNSSRKRPPRPRAIPFPQTTAHVDSWVGAGVQIRTPDDRRAKTIPAEGDRDSPPINRPRPSPAPLLSPAFTAVQEADEGKGERFLLLLSPLHMSPFKFVHSLLALLYDGIGWMLRRLTEDSIISLCRKLQTFM
jgi:hypothetical protein